MAEWLEDRARHVHGLLTDVASSPDGTYEPSIYETARLVVHAPWLAGHQQRVRFLLDAQRPLGSWGGPEGYSLIPTLSATGALLAEITRAEQPGHRVRAAARAGMKALLDALVRYRHTATPDTDGADVLLPALVAEVNGHMALPLPLPHDVTNDTYARLSTRLRDGSPLTGDTWHLLEAFAPAVRRARFVATVEGSVGQSPAATAAWLGLDHRPVRPCASVDYLERVQAHHGGPVPVVTTTVSAERGRVMSRLASAGLVFRRQPVVRSRRITRSRLVRIMEEQLIDGSWTDHRHASPFYATAKAVATLAAERSSAAEPALARASVWTTAAQRDDGSWGRWSGTVEETCYAIRTLMSAGRINQPGTRTAIAAGCAFLLAADGPALPLWHGKDLYAPTALIRAERIAVLSMVAAVPELLERTTRAA